MLFDRRNISQSSSMKPITASGKPGRPGLLGVFSPLIFPSASILVALLLTALPSAPAWAHPGKTDEFGGHYSEKLKKYHYHKPRKNRGSKKRDALSWVDFKKKGLVKGWVEKIERPNAVWVRIDHKPAYFELSPLLSKTNRDDQKNLVRVWLKHVSPEETGHLNKKFSRAFNQRVVFELQRKLSDKRVSVQFVVLGDGAARIRGMVFLEEENINLWLVTQGWSFYVLSDGENKFEMLFRSAEDNARRRKSGIWGALR